MDIIILAYVTLLFVFYLRLSYSPNDICTYILYVLINGNKYLTPHVITIYNRFSSLLMNTSSEFAYQLVLVSLVSYTIKIHQLTFAFQVLTLYLLLT